MDLGGSDGLLMTLKLPSQGSKQQRKEEDGVRDGGCQPKTSSFKTIHTLSKSPPSRRRGHRTLIVTLTGPWIEISRTQRSLGSWVLW